MGTHSETTPDKIVFKEPLDQSTLSASSSTPTGNSFIEEPTHQEKRTSQILTDSPGEGEWICGTDLLQMDTIRKRPRLLPHDVKMFIFIEKESKKMMDFSSWRFNKFNMKKTETREPWDRKKLYNIKIYRKLRTVKKVLNVHPKKRFLQRFLQCQKCH